jgi:signal transduction histidine kinase
MALHTAPPRTTSARRTLTTLLLIPMLSLVGLWGFAASVTIGNVTNNDQYNKVTNTIGSSVVGLEQTLEVEDALTLGWLSTGRQSAVLRSHLLAARQGTSTVAATARTAMASVRGLLNTTGQSHLDSLVTALDGLSGIRAAVDSGAGSTVTAYTAYSAIDSSLYGFLHNSTPPTDATLALITQAGIADSRAADFTAAANGLIEGALAANGRMTQPDRVLFAQIVAQQNLEISDALALAPPDLAPLLEQIFDGTAYRQLFAAQAQIIGAPASSPVPMRQATFDRTAQAIQAAEQSALPRIGALDAAESAQLSNGLRTELYLAAGLGLIAVLVSGYVAHRFGTRLRVELTGLYASAREMAQERLPQLVEQLRRGEEVDVAAESPSLRPGRVTEIAQVARAFSTVQRTAVEAAVGQANLRKGVNHVFVSLSLRNQSLLHRQLGMLDDMERATSDPVALGDLFLLDHLTTRMRRHAEGLLILAGETPGRGWRDPVPVAEVLNAAVAEIEDYVRVDMITESADFVAGTAVNDVIHLLAELIENATTFSPPKTRVEIRGDSVGHGFAVEIEDRGLGMPAEEIAAINERLATPPEFDLANTDQLGLFVAAKLAARHRIKIALRQSPFGGTTAIVLLPVTIIVPADGASWAAGITDAGEYPPANSLAPGQAPPGQERGSGDRHPQAFGLTGRHRRFDSALDPGHVPLPRPAPPAPEPPAPLAPSAPAPSAAGPAYTPVPAEGLADRGWFSRIQGSIGSPDGTGFDAAPLNQAAAEAGTRPGLPRRARGTNLAPQLRARLGSASAADSREGRQPSALPAAAEPRERSPEEASSLLSELQDGWQRARIDNLDDFYGEDQP